MIQKIEAFFDFKEGKEKILDDDIYEFSKDKDVPCELALLIQIVRELKRIK
jgi:hypothetical protein